MSITKKLFVLTLSGSFFIAPPVSVQAIASSVQGVEKVPELSKELDEVKELEKENKEKEKSLSALDDAISSTKESKEKKSKEVAALNEDAKKKEAEVASLKSQLETRKAEIEAAKKAKEAEERKKDGSPYFGPDGLLVMQASQRADHVLYLLHKIPDHRNGAWAHAEWGIDTLIDELTVEEATWVIHRAEGAGFGQTGAGYAGYDTHESHLAFLNQQVLGRFKDEPGEMGIYSLLKAWGTFHYGGY